MSANIISILKENKVESQVNFMNQTKITFEKRPGNDKIMVKSKQTLQGTVEKDVTLETCKMLTQKLLLFSQMTGKIHKKIGTGHKFPDYESLPNLLEEGTSDISHKQGQVMILEFWANWCPCDVPIQKHYDAYVNNEEKWSNKVKMFVVNLDHQAETAVQKVSDKEWSKVKHLFIEGWDSQNQVIKELKIQNVPFICIVNQKGVIEYAGNSHQIDFETVVNNMLDNHEEEGWKQDQIIELKEVLSLKNLEKEFPDANQLLCYEMKITDNYINESMKSTIQISVSTFQASMQTMQRFKGLILKLNKKLKFKENYMKLTEVPQQSKERKCWQCGKDLIFPYYWLKWEENSDKFGCRSCIEKPAEQQGHHYRYEKNSILLCSEWRRISLKSLGNNIQPQDPKQVTKSIRFCCNICQKVPHLKQDIGKPRYLCLNCKSEPTYEDDLIDICQECMNEYLQKNQDVVKRMDVEGHTSCHPWLRILYHVQGYYSF